MIRIPFQLKSLSKRTLIIAAIILVTLKSSAGQNSDFWSWNYIAVNAKVIPSLDIRIQEEFRLDDPFSHMDKYFTEWSVQYQPGKTFSFEGAYRNIREHQKDDSWEKQHRLHFSAEAQKKLGRFTPAYRLRWQNYPDAWNRSKTLYFYLRHKMKLEWDIPNFKVNPEFSAELFHKFLDDGTNQLSMIRFSLGSSYKFSKHHRINFSLRKQYELDEKTPENAWILSLGYRFDIF